MITKMGYSWQKIKAAVWLNLRRFLKNCILAFQNQKWHPSPFYPLLLSTSDIVLFLISLVKKTAMMLFQSKQNSKWYLVAFGMMEQHFLGWLYFGSWRSGAASGEQFKYFQFVLGNAMGFIFIAKTIAIVLPNELDFYLWIYWTSSGTYSYKTAATIFLISRTIGSAFRLYLVVIVLQRFVFDFYGIPFAVTVLISLALIFAYTYRGGKTIIITDTLQTFFLVFCLYDYLFYYLKLKSQYYRSLWSR
jgi:hypothetical protein